MENESKKVLCKRCNAELKETDIYCSECGTKRDEEDYDPKEKEMQCLYGPPPFSKIRF